MIYGIYAWNKLVKAIFPEQERQLLLLAQGSGSDIPVPFTLFLVFILKELLHQALGVIKQFSCSTQPSMKFFLLINVKMPTIVGILIFIRRKNSFLSLSEPENKPEFLDIFIHISI